MVVTRVLGRLSATYSWVSASSTRKATRLLMLPSTCRALASLPVRAAGISRQKFIA